jgi:hypothetical protein
MMRARMLEDLTDAIDAALDGRSEAGNVPPWLGWLAIALLRQRERQAWHRYIVKTRLPEVRRAEDSGDVPGLPGWSYRFHGIGCCLTGPDGECIDVDVRDAEARIIDPYFFAWRVRSVCARALPEVRLWRWMLDQELLVAALSDLRGWGAIEYPDGDHHFRLAEPLEGRVRGVAGCDFQDPVTQARWSAVLGDSEELALVAKHRAWVLSKLEDPKGRSILAAAAEILGREDLLDACRRLVARQDPLTSGSAIEILRRRDYSGFTEEARAVLALLSPSEDLPYPAYQALAYLLEYGADPDSVRKRFVEFASVERARGFKGNPFLGEYAVLALRFFPSLAMALVRRALRSTTPICVEETAAMLCAIGEPWCVRELTSALRERPGDSYVAEALRRMPSQPARKQAERTYVPPEHDHTRLGFTFEEVLHNSVGALFDEPLRQAQRLAPELRARYPGTWQG